MSNSTLFQHAVATKWLTGLDSGSLYCMKTVIKKTGYANNENIRLLLYRVTRLLGDIVPDSSLQYIVVTRW